MQDIKPDTSLYTDLPNKLRALAEALPSAPLELLPPTHGASWEPAMGRSKELCALLSQDYEFRIKPKPRELWAIQRPDGSYWEDSNNPGKPMIYTRKPDCAPGNTPVRFVEQPE